LSMDAAGMTPVAKELQVWHRRQHS
jgi:hypothetical protein